LEKEKLEAARKQIEAHGIATFQHIVSDGISDQLLKWKGIEATKELAELSPRGAFELDTSGVGTLGAGRGVAGR